MSGTAFGSHYTLLMPRHCCKTTSPQTRCKNASNRDTTLLAHNAASPVPPFTNPTAGCQGQQQFKCPTSTAPYTAVCVSLLTLQGCCALCVLLGQLLRVTAGRQGNGIVVASGGTTTLLGRTNRRCGKESGAGHSNVVQTRALVTCTQDTLLALLEQFCVSRSIAAVPTLHLKTWH